MVLISAKYELLPFKCRLGRQWISFDHITNNGDGRGYSMYGSDDSGAAEYLGSGDLVVFDEIDLEKAVLKGGPIPDGWVTHLPNSYIPVSDQIRDYYTEKKTAYRSAQAARVNPNAAATPDACLNQRINYKFSVPDPTTCYQLHDRARYSEHPFAVGLAGEGRYRYPTILTSMVLTPEQHSGTRPHTGVSSRREGRGGSSHRESRGGGSRRYQCDKEAIGLHETFILFSAPQEGSIRNFYSAYFGESNTSGFAYLSHESKWEIVDAITDNGYGQGYSMFRQHIYIGSGNLVVYDEIDGEELTLEGGPIPSGWVTHFPHGYCSVSDALRARYQEKKVAFRSFLKDLVDIELEPDACIASDEAIYKLASVDPATRYRLGEVAVPSHQYAVGFNGVRIRLPTLHSNRTADIMAIYPWLQRMPSPEPSLPQSGGHSRGRRRYIRGRGRGSRSGYEV
ncbi:hypothetical protein O1611_g6160 [Lasiodiplodia mahajangana]|uniref:Uncharacterized protein n=1 Tax=Lasiodiplodia mahajangana TaxID=1108764 RepID=A0ACC2JIX5_9PEZI|nr:hypothetical protein O1611_g6160 [Lasiodiplodia mahajangana]